MGWIVDIASTIIFVQRRKRHERQGALKQNGYQDRTILGTTQTYRCLLRGGANFTSIVIVDNNAKNWKTFCHPFCWSRCECCLCCRHTGSSSARQWPFAIMILW